jgi:hypothetical protein
MSPAIRLVLRVGFDPTHFVFVQPDEGDGMRSGRMDHFGAEVGSEEAVDEILASARRFRQTDSRVDISGSRRRVRDHQLLRRVHLPDAGRGAALPSVSHVVEEETVDSTVAPRAPERA